MFIPYPAASDDATSSLPTDNGSPRFEIKPWRTAAPVVEQTPVIRRSFWNPIQDGQEFRWAFAVGLAMMLIIVGILVGKVVICYIALALFALTILGKALTDLWGGILLYIAYLSMEGMFKYTTEFSNVVYAVAPILGLTLLVIWRLSTRQQQQYSSTQHPMPPLSLPVLLTGCIFAISVANPEASDPVSAIASTLLWYLSPLSFFFIAYALTLRTTRIASLLYLVIALGTVVSIFAMFQYQMGETWCMAHITGLKSTQHLAWYNQEGGKVISGAFRPISTSPSAGGYTGMSMYGILAAVCMILIPSQPLGRRVLVTVLMVIMGVALIIAGIRQVFLVLLVGLAVVLYLQVRTLSDTVRVYLTAVGMTLLLAGSFVVANNLTHGKLTARFGSILSDPINSYGKKRGNHFAYLLQGIMVRPLGIGPQRLAASFQQGEYVSNLPPETLPLRDRETQWNALQADLGIVGVVVVAWFMLALLHRGWKICRSIQDPHLKSNAIFTYSIVVSTVVFTFGSPSLQQNVLFWMSSGILLALPRVAARNRLASRPTDSSELPLF